MKRVIFAAIAAAACVAATIGTPLAAHAQSAEAGAVVLECTADLPHFGSAAQQTDGTCSDGTVPAAIAGAGVTVNPTSEAGGLGSPSVDVASYTETCAGPLPPGVGFSQGTVTGNFSTVPGSFSVDYNWTRVGLTAVVLLSNPDGNANGIIEGIAGSDGAAVAAFLPLAPLDVCPTIGDQKALVVAVGAAADAQA